jgi:hypothetical protein
MSTSVPRRLRCGAVVVWSYGSWIYNYLCHQCLSPVNAWVRIPVTPGLYSIQHYVIKFVSDLRQVGGFPPGTPVFTTNKADVRYHNPNQPSTWKSWYCHVQGVVRHLNNPVRTRVTALDSSDSLYFMYLAYTVKPMDNTVRFKLLDDGPKMRYGTTDARWR